MTARSVAKTLYSIDLFAGAGGLTQGFRGNGFHPLAANDFDADAATTFQRNFGDTPFLLKPIEQLGGRELLDTAGIAPGELDVLLGGPPCQAFSVYNHQRGFHDERSGLFREYLRAVEGLAPRVVVMENVVGMTSLGGGRAIEETQSHLEKLGYAVQHRILRAEDFGVPQERRRLFIIGSRIGPIEWPKARFFDPNGLFGTAGLSYVTVHDAIADLPVLRLGEGRDEMRPYTRKAHSKYAELMRAGSEGVTNHVAPALAQINIDRMKFIPEGGSWRDLPVRLLPAGMKRARRSDHTKRYGRLERKGLFSTILTKADLHWGAYIHPGQDRTLTVRECARAQSFPDRFIFVGSRGEQYRQVGNAVPPLLASAVAESVRTMIERDSSTTNLRTKGTVARSA